VSSETLHEYFFVRYPNLPMHSLRCVRVESYSILCLSSDLRSHLTTLSTLSTVGKRIGLNHAINTSSKVCVHISYLLSPSYVVDKTIADAFYAVVAAVYLDQVRPMLLLMSSPCPQGSTQARKLVRDLLLPELDGVDVADFVRLSRPHVLLKQLLQENKEEAPSHKYHVITACALMMVGW
jgi:dsRNA-specific ribonuclease